QVADCWHLLKNLREALARLFGRLDAAVADALQPSPIEASSATGMSEASPTTPEPEPQHVVSEPTPLCTSAPVPSARQAARAAGRQQQAARHAEVRVLREQGLSLRQISRQTGLSLKAVRRYWRQVRCPDWKPGRCGRTRLANPPRPGLPRSPTVSA